LAALSKAAATETANTAAIIIGSLVILCVGAGVAFKVYQRKLSNERRTRKINTYRSRVDDRATVYGITTVINTPQEQQFKNHMAYRSKRITS